MYTKKTPTISRIKTDGFFTFHRKGSPAEILFGHCVLCCLLMLFLVSNLPAQSGGNENTVDRTLRGSGRVNQATLGMEFDLPLGSYPGRGINVPINLSYSSKVWRSEPSGSTEIQGPGGNNNFCLPTRRVKFAEKTASGWTTSLGVPYIEYVGINAIFDHTGFPVSYTDIDCPLVNGGNDFYPDAYVKRIVIHLPGGASHELRADDTIYTFAVGQTDGNSPYNPASWNTVYYAVDGSNLKYVQNSSANTYRLLMPDGSFYDFDPASALGADRKAVKYTDRNGNFTSYYGPGSVDENGVTHPNGYWKDTFGRTLSIPFGIAAPANPTTAQNPQVYKLPGMTGTFKFQWKRLKGDTAAESGLTDFSQNLRYYANRYTYFANGRTRLAENPFGTYLYLDGGEYNSFILGGRQIFNPVVLTEIELPTGGKYQFKYDIYGRIQKIIYPTGGIEVFEYQIVPTLSLLELGDTSWQTNHGVVSRKVYESENDSAPYEWTYSADHVAPQGYAVIVNNPDGTRNERFIHRGQDAGVNVYGTFGYDNGLAGMTYEERVYDNANPRRLISQKLTNWTKKSFAIPNTEAIADWHPRVSSEETIIYDRNGNGISATVGYEYEDETNLARETPLLLKKSARYAFVAAGSAPPPMPVRTSETTYLINDPNYLPVRSFYTAQNMNGLATAISIRDGAGNIVSRSEVKYDESGYPLLAGGSTTNWQNPGTNYRGNPTSSKVWDNTRGNWNNDEAYIATHAQFDNFGNQRKAWDAKGNLTETDYASPQGQDYKFIYPTKMTAPIPDPSGQNGSNSSFVTTMTFDPLAGVPLTTVDPNGLETRIEYDPATLRPVSTKTFYQGSQVGSMSEIVYYDEPNNYRIKSRTRIDTEKWTEKITFFDGLGRAYKTEEVNSNGNIFVEKEFDAEGRVKRVTNPFRANETKHWTTNFYDESSRLKEIVSPDGSKINIDYGVLISDIVGVSKQITDQAGNKRRGISDALGRMIRVVEDPDGQNLATDYLFDTLGNLRKTTQGEQNRYFSHDSLGRLRYAKQPEQEANGSFVYTDAISNNSQWSVKYVYDENGNIVSTTDARGVTVAGVYDNFNRLKQRNYSDATPDVNFYYDGRGLDDVPAFSKGKLTRVQNSLSETRYTGFDNLGRILTHQQITEGRIFQTSYAYNLTSLIAQTYPSGRVVNFEFNRDGDLSRVGGQNGQTSALYANAISYNASGAVEKLRLGNGRWETASYNNRQQITQIGLGRSATDTSLLKLDFDYGDETQNNGSLRRQTIVVPGVGAEPGFTAAQTYTYDNLNRLRTAQESIGGSQTWKQAFTYDRYGNRRFDPQNTSTMLSSAPSKITNPLINTSDNRLKKDQDGNGLADYDYDRAGNLTLDAENRRFVYDAENHQTAFFQATNNTTSPDAVYLYDGEGKRIKKISSTETVIFVYDGVGNLIAEYSTALNNQPQISYLTQDHLGSPRIVTNALGAVIARKDFSAFGDETLTAQRTDGLGYKPDTIRQDYTGYQKDDESGLEFAQARYYNSLHGRFTSVDPLTASANMMNPQTFNRYSYVLNSPYKFVDPLGLISQKSCCSGKEIEEQIRKDFKRLVDIETGKTIIIDEKTMKKIVNILFPFYHSAASAAYGAQDALLREKSNPPQGPVKETIKVTKQMPTTTTTSADSVSAQIGISGSASYEESAEVTNVSQGVTGKASEQGEISGSTSEKTEITKSVTTPGEITEVTTETTKPPSEAAKLMSEANKNLQGIADSAARALNGVQVTGLEINDARNTINSPYKGTFKTTGMQLRPYFNAISKAAQNRATLDSKH